MLTLDGVMQAPGGPGEDRSGVFKYGGWVAPYGDEVYGKAVKKELKPADYLLGGKTFRIWVIYYYVVKNDNHIVSDGKFLLTR
jgi:hypothetical protein